MDNISNNSKYIRFSFEIVSKKRHYREFYDAKYRKFVSIKRYSEITKINEDWYGKFAEAKTFMHYLNSHYIKVCAANSNGCYEFINKYGDYDIIGKRDVFSWSIRENGE